MSDDGFEDFLRRSAADYHRPPAQVPAEEMWERIRAARAERSAPPAAITRLGSRRGWVVIVAGLAATLLVGIAIGRLTRGRSVAPQGSQQVVSITPVAPSGNNATGEPVVIESVPPDSARGPSAVSPRPPAPRQRDARNRMLDAPPSGSADAAYRLATLQHLAQTEALLTTYRTETAADAQLASWARDLLSTTRLLIDSPAAQDPQRRRLFEDLEIVLVQIVQLAPGAGDEDRASIDRALERGHVMTRLRAAPMGAASGT